MSQQPYKRLFSVVGVAAFWLSFSSLWAQRAAQRLDVPLNVFKEWAKGEGRAEDITMIAIYVCWPFILAAMYLLWRATDENAGVKRRCLRLPAPFGLDQGLTGFEKCVYRLFFLFLFWFMPMIHIVFFAWQFFHRSCSDPPVFVFSLKSWWSGTDELYGALTYFGWTPILVIAVLALIGFFNIAFFRSLFRRAHIHQRQ